MATGENHWNWKGGLPRCADCGKQLKNYHNKRCKPCSDADSGRRGKLSSTHQGARPWRVGKKIPGISGEKNYQWKGDKAGYSAVHYWVARTYGKASKCDHCGVEGKRYCWANKDGRYLRERDNWLQLCYSCHKKYDIKNGFGRPSIRFEGLSMPGHLTNDNGSHK